MNHFEIKIMEMGNGDEFCCRRISKTKWTIHKLSIVNTETPCPDRGDETHCEHWYDGEAPCCGCGVVPYVNPNDCNCKETGDESI